jgi:OOP family OmpA-OmpF porin
MRAGLSVLALVVVAGTTAHAIELELPPTAQQTVTRDTEQDRFFAPVAPFADGELPVQLFEGAVARSAWRIDVAGITPLQIAVPLRAQLVASGYDIVLDCAAQDCGGYDFRFEMEVLPAPNMHVNLRNFHVVTGVRGQQAVTILASASSGASFVQIIQAGGDTQSLEATVPSPAVIGNAAPVGSPADPLMRDGRAVLDGLDFESGTSDLGAGPFAVLEQLAERLAAQPDMRVALVGHTDNVGSLEANITLARSRAEAVRVRLIEEYGIAAARLEAQGIGYLAPIASNLSAEGREANRRVEVVLLEE